jgi:hypothetical protein
MNAFREGIENTQSTDEYSLDDVIDWIETVYNYVIPENKEVGEHGFNVLDYYEMENIGAALKKMSERIAELEYDRKLNAAIVQQNTELKERIAALEAVADAAQEVEYIDIGDTFELQDIERYFYSHKFCPGCGYKKPDGHWRDCKLGIALDALKEAGR